ncbi:MAG: phage holin family protein [Intrasporangium sp.]|uniref:phage holin family protein n=1 Tax=Intrasporangium sp. TaxID=1925024 RepID=UPI002648E9AA|nr:phage holin family protein [Intrasporangium sp.]MDN5794818.1 phage holin family protein [Intrasporangium sp.]
MLVDFAIKTVINGIALWIAAWLVPGIAFGSSPDTWVVVRTVVVVALIFGLINAFVRPVAKILSLPLIILTLGLFVFVVNALMLELTSWVAEQFSLPFHVDEFFWDAILGSLVITFVSMVLSSFNPRD